MLGWNKQFLLKRRVFSLSVPKQPQDFFDEELQKSELETAISHLRSLLYSYLSVKYKTENSKNQLDYDQLKPMPVPLSFGFGQQSRIIKALYRRISNALFSFGKPTPIQEEMEECFKQHLGEEEPSSQNCFRNIQNILIRSLLKIKHQKKTVHQNTQIKAKSIKNLSMRETQRQLIKQLYDILDVSRIEAMDYFIEGIDLQDNISLSYKHQKPRNRIIKKQIKEYAINYQNRGKGKIREFVSAVVPEIKINLPRAKSSGESDNKNERSFKSRYPRKSRNGDRQNSNKNSCSWQKSRNSKIGNRMLLKPIKVQNSKKLKIIR